MQKGLRVSLLVLTHPFYPTSRIAGLPSKAELQARAGLCTDEPSCRQGVRLSQIGTTNALKFGFHVVRMTGGPHTRHSRPP